MKLHSLILSALICLAAVNWLIGEEWEFFAFLAILSAIAAGPRK